MARNNNKEKFYFNHETLELIRDNPHALGWIAGYTKLTPLHSEWIKYVWVAGKSVALMAHRGSYKSTAIVLVGALWYLLFNPNARIAVVRKTYADAADATETIAKMFDIPEVRNLFKFAHGAYPEFTKRKEGVITMSFKESITPEGNLNAFGIASPFTGRHFDFILCDDISTLKDRLSKAEREFTKNIWRELATNVINRGCPCCYVGTPWAREGVEEIIPEPKKYSIYDCNLISQAQLDYIRTQTTPALFAANYELKFVADDDALFKDPVYDNWHTSDIESVRGHIDSAYGGSDYCALTFAARRKDGKLQMIGFTHRGAISEWIPRVAELCKLYRVKKVFVEKQSDRGWTASMLRKERINVSEYDENLKKQHKIATFLYELWPRIVWAPETDDEYLSQVIDWTAESKSNDDAPDSAASLIRACYSTKGARAGRWTL